jgi:CubicO group peptidase (beta-lactamase class C family)
VHGALPSEVPLGSVRKWTTAAVVASLHDDGLVDLDAPVARWLPAWADRPGVTLRRLLSHTSGLPMRPPAGTCRDLGTLGACVDRLAELPPAFEPGTRFGYSTTGFHVAARVAEVAGQAPFEELFAARVTGPLGIDSARFEAAGPGLPDMTGTLYLSPDDLLRFVRGVATGEGGWLSPEAVAMLHAGHTGGVEKVGTIPRGEWWTEGEDPYGLGMWRAGVPVEGLPRFVFSEGKQALVAGYDRALDRAFVVGFAYAPGTGIASRVLPHEVLHDLCAAGERAIGTGVDDADVRCLPFEASPEAQATYRRCRAGRGDHRICLTAARRAR